MTGVIIYEWGILAMFLGSILHFLMLMAFRRRVAPWQAKAFYAFGSVIFFGWLYFRIWDDLPRDLTGGICAWVYVVSLFNLVFSYRRVPYQGETDHA